MDPIEYEQAAILANKLVAAPSTFAPQALLGEPRRQKGAIGRTGQGLEKGEADGPADALWGGPAAIFAAHAA
jgi:hypothetical protein